MNGIGNNNDPSRDTSAQKSDTDAVTAERDEISRKNSCCGITSSIDNCLCIREDPIVFVQK
jgi:hypothetical protein